jgi:hypothetical protein
MGTSSPTPGGPSYTYPKNIGYGKQWKEISSKEPFELETSISENSHNVTNLNKMPEKNFQLTFWLSKKNCLSRGGM